ncbi:MAG: Hsp20/alpha crystallin family protein [Kiritimatiellae bacterium]|nr:Hsp20/alpha crystallin family protein [Kiritimatiellia bacterium]
MSIIRWTGSRPKTLLDEMLGVHDDLLRDFWGWGTGTRCSYPPVNAWVSDDAVVLEAELPGVDPKAVEISLEDGLLRLSGNREPVALKDGEAFYRRERRHGRFNRAFRLPFAVDGKKVKASYKHGILTITLERAEEDKPRKIAVEAA